VGLRWEKKQSRPKLFLGMPATPSGGEKRGGEPYRSGPENETKENKDVTARTRGLPNGVLEKKKAENEEKRNLSWIYGKHRGGARAKGAAEWVRENEVPTQGRREGYEHDCQRQETGGGSTKRPRGKKEASAGPRIIKEKPASRGGGDGKILLR